MPFPISDYGRNSLIRVFIMIPLLGSCAIGAIDLPETDVPQTWQQQTNAAGTAQTIPAKWWSQFNDPRLDELIEKAIKANPDQRLALARIEEARAFARNASAQLLPVLQGVASAERRGVPNNRNNFRTGIVEQYTTGLEASWELDLFGRNRQRSRAAQAELDAVIADSNAITLSLVAELVQRYTLYRLYDVQARLAAENGTSQEGVLRVTQARYEQGVEENLEVMRSKALLQTTRARIPLYRDLAQAAAYQMDYLTGEKPGANATLLTNRQDIPLIDRDVFLDIPLQVIRKRPDIMAAERRIIATTSLNRAAVADLYPSVSISGLLGLSAITTGELLSSDSKTWSVGGSILAPLLNFGRIRSNIDVSDARQQQALILYEQAVLAALRDVETAASSYRNSRERFVTLEEAMASSREAVEIARKQYTAGILSQLDVLQAEQASYTAQEAAAQAVAEMTQNFIFLSRALALFPDKLDD